MALRSISIGSLINAYAYDDAVYPNGLSTDGAIRTSNTPVIATDVLRQSDVGIIAAPASSAFAVFALSGSLSNERLLVAANGLKLTDGGANGNGTYEIDAAAKPNMAGSNNSDHIDIDADNKSLRLGADQDATLLYDGTDLQINPRAVGAGKLTVSGIVNTTESYQVDGIKVIGNQGAAVAALTDNSGGTANDTIEALVDPADLPLTADMLRDDLVANLIPALRNNIADLTAKVNALSGRARDHGLIAT